MVNTRSSKTTAAQHGNLAEKLRHLSPKRQEIIRPVLEDPRGYVLLSVRALADRLGTDPATTVRIVQGLGFPTYKDFQRHLHDLSVAYATSLDTMKAAEREGTGPATFVRAALHRDMQNLHALNNSLNADKVCALAKRIYDAQKILLLGGDAATSLVHHLDYHLTMIGLPVLSATTAGRVSHVVRTVGRKDLVIGISFRRGLRQTVEGVQTAKRNGAFAVGITDTFVSPLARAADECFIASVETPSFGASYVAPMALIDAIVSAVATLKPRQIMSLIKQADEEQRRGFRWYKAEY
ncbi:MAG TPA: MurR/RpiR family transcriptional regulator [Candidatus Methylomirabilis sp.]|nr:MurR/RpiR family transcriptional regulator [Candidatus Methylomirabilis sp.]